MHVLILILICFMSISNSRVDISNIFSVNLPYGDFRFVLLMTVFLSWLFFTAKQEVYTWIHYYVCM